MDYYIFKQLVNQDGAEPTTAQQSQFTGRYYANFRSMSDYVYWSVITPLMEMKNGHPIKTLDVECCRLKGTLTVEADVVTVQTVHHEYLFEKVSVNPLDEILEGAGDYVIENAGHYLVKKHIGALKELAK